MGAFTLIDGPIGTQLQALGWDLPAPAWSARVVDEGPEVLAGLHRAYAQAGARVHTACTFRTTPRGVGPGWRRQMWRAVAIARDAVPREHRIAGSLAPLEDCYEPWRSPDAASSEHRILADGLAEAGVDLILCETFANLPEAQAALRAGRETGLPTWVALTAGPNAGLLCPERLARGLVEAADGGAAAVFINCISAGRTLPYVIAARKALCAAGFAKLPLGVYANGGVVGEQFGWSAEGEVANYLAVARTWAERGVSMFGGCCGTGPDHIRVLNAELSPSAGISL